MRILCLHVEGFRSLRDVTWAPGKLNVVIGPNGTGKSNLLRLLELTARAARGGLSRYVQASGGMQALLWDARAEEILVKLKMSPSDEGSDKERNSLTYELRLGRIGGSSGYRVTHELLGNYWASEREDQAERLKLLERDPASGRIYPHGGEALNIRVERFHEEETILSLVAFPPFRDERGFPEGMALRYQDHVASWSVHHDFRVDPEASIRSPILTRFERRVDPDGENLVNVLHTLYTEDREFKGEVNLAMRAAFGEDFEELVFSPAADQRVQLRVQWRSLKHPQSTADLSDGILRFLFLLAVLASPHAAPVIAIDEPETGLHPGMMPIVAEYAVEAARTRQVVLTTHSPAFLDAFRETTPQTTVALWEDGQTILRVLDGDVLDRWRQEYSLGKLLTSGELEQLAGAE